MAAFCFLLLLCLLLPHFCQSLDPGNFHVNSYKVELWIGEDLDFFQGNMTFTGTTTEDFIRISIPNGNFQISTVQLRDGQNLDTFMEITDYDLLDGPNWTSFEASVPPGSGNEYELVIVFVGYTRKSDTKGFYKYADGEFSYVLTAFGDYDAFMTFPFMEDLGLLVKMSVVMQHQVKYEFFGAFQGAKFTKNGLKTMITEEFSLSFPIPSYLFVLFVGTIYPTCRVNQCGNIKITSYSRFTPAQWPKLEFRHIAEFLNEETSTIFDLCDAYFDITDTKKPQVHNMILPGLGTNVIDSVSIIFYPEEVIFAADESRSLDIDTMIMVTGKVINQYFGVAMVPESRRYIWVTEGLKTLLKYQLMLEEQEFPTEMMMREVKLTALYDDAWQHSHALISGKLGQLTSYKAANLMLMIQDALTKPLFRHAVRQFYALNLHKPINSTHLATEFQKQVRHLSMQIPYDFHTLMSTWSTNIGYPMVNVELRNSRILITQTRFVYSKNRNEDNQIWEIPISYYFPALDPDYVSRTQMIEQTWLGIISHDLEPQDFVIVNKGWTGLYRVNYTERMWNLLIDQLNSDGFEVILPENRAQLIDDSMHLARAGYLSYDIPLRLIRYLHQETDQLPWYVAFENLKFLFRMLDGPSDEDKVRAQLVKQFIKANAPTEFRQLPFTKTAKIKIELACFAGSEDCLDQAKGADIMNASIGVDVGCHIARNTATLADMFEYIEDRISDEYVKRKYYLQVMSCTSDSLTMLKIVHATMDPNSRVLSPYERAKVREFVAEYASYESLRQIINDVLYVLEVYLSEVNVEEAKEFIKVIASRIHEPALSLKYSHLVQSLEKHIPFDEEERYRIQEILTFSNKWRHTYGLYVAKQLNEYSNNLIYH